MVMMTFADPLLAGTEVSYTGLSWDRQCEDTVLYGWEIQSYVEVK